MLRSLNLRFAYANGQAFALPDLDIATGEQLLILGPSGSGKSTLLGLLSGLLTPLSGTIDVAGTRVDVLHGSARDRWRGAHVGFIYQRPRLIASQRVVDNIELPSRLSAKPLARAQTLAALDSLGIKHLALRYPDACSIGEQQRIGILRALLHAPTLMLCDEPTSALDRDNALRVGELLCARAAAQQATLVVVTHDERLVPLFRRTIELPTLLPQQASAQNLQTR